MTNRLVETLTSSLGWIVPSMAVVIIAFLMSVLVISGFLT
jgi:hypothetical protein